MPLRQFRLYLDECGTEDYACVDQAGGRHLSLVGVIMDRDAVQAATDNLNRIRERFFERHPDDPPAIFHRTDIQRYRGAFGVLKDDALREEFDRWWIRYVRVCPYRVICVVIDKKAMHKKENWRIKHPYHYGMSVIVEKYARFLERHDANGDIMPESRGTRKDDALQAAYDDVWENGTYYVARGVIQARLPATRLKFRKKHDNITGLQLCDSLAKAAQDYVLLQRREIEGVSAFTQKLHDVLREEKFDRSSVPPHNLWGYGMKFLP